MAPQDQREIERKYERVDLAAAEKRLAELGAGGPDDHVEVDHYFNAPDRDFVRTNEAFRLRQVGSANWLTWKGPREPGLSKNRPELEIPLLPGEEAARQMLTLLNRLGFRFVAVVRKRRRSYTLTRQGWPVTVCLDEVEGVGSFVELEVLCPQEQARQADVILDGVAAELDLPPTHIQQRSYLALLLQNRAQEGESRQPVIARTRAELRQALAEARRQRHTVGLVPTMGALHEGHRSLIETSRAQDSFVVVSIFVNPTQFAPHEDLTRYPRPFEADVALCAAAGVDLIFHPSPEEVYPAGFQTYVEVTELQKALEGASRPSHFRGVCTVVLKLFNCVQPDRAYFGQKDAQQARIIQQMVSDLDVPVDVRVLPTVREPDGLALSSRNRYLDSEQRRHAVALYRALTAAQDAHAAGERDATALRRTLTEQIAATPGAALDYAAVVDADSFQPVERLDRATLLALAVRFKDTRLIDNLLLPE